MHETDEKFGIPLCFDGFERDLAVSIVEVHDRLVTKKGYAPALLSAQREQLVGRVESVVFASFSTVFSCTPKSRFEDVFDQVSFFAAHLSKDHIFPDGNKRTTVVASLAFLGVSGYQINLSDPADPEQNEIYLWIQDVVTGGRSQDELAAYLRENSSRDDDY